ncbi:hypothetical protein [Pseudooceanicola sp.]|uniref:hypothetical protein n=1 Tax=Pseudooceanicola sp. TaxID=1914328 RepID=UPI004058A93E
MSAPHTNIEKQERRHAVPIWGIIIAVLFGMFVGGFLSTSTAFFRADEPEGAATQIDGRTGEAEPAAESVGANTPVD